MPVRYDVLSVDSSYFTEDLFKVEVCPQTWCWPLHRHASAGNLLTLLASPPRSGQTSLSSKLIGYPGTSSMS